MVNDPNLIFEKMDADYRKFFFDTMATGALKALTKEKSHDEKVILCNYVTFILVFGSYRQYPGGLHPPLLGAHQARPVCACVLRRDETSV